jgi:hypothetical protein
VKQSIDPQQIMHYKLIDYNLVPQTISNHKQSLGCSPEINNPGLIADFLLPY